MKIEGIKCQEAINTINTITKDIEEIKNKQRKMNNTITDIKNTLEGNNKRITEAEEWNSELEDRMVEIVADEQSKGTRMKIIEENFRDLWDSLQGTHHKTRDTYRLKVEGGKNIFQANAGQKGRSSNTHIR